MTLPTFKGDAGIDDIVAALMRDGGVIVDGWASPETVDAVVAELRPHFDAEGDRFHSDFNGYQTNRLSGILGYSPASAALIGHERLLAVAERVLGPHCHSFRIGSTTGIEILPGEGHQRLHRDDSIYPLPHPGPERQIGTNWALTEFTAENGATRVVPGSHRWDDSRTPGDDDEVAVAAMPKGAVLIYLGSLYHGGGENRTATPRIGLVNTYALGWLRQEENQYLTVPREMAARYPERIQRLMGYQVHGDDKGVLGWYPDNPDGLH